MRWIPFQVVMVAAITCSAHAQTGTSQIGTVKGEPLTFRSAYLLGEITVLPGVFQPNEAERFVLPFLKENAAIFRGKTVLEIGTGSGIISLYAATLGATKVVSTDINESAIATASRNAAKLGFASVIEPRRVPLSDMSAYSVIAADERFDIIISNPPYSLDLDATGNNAVTDTGDLGFSIVRGLEQHLEPGGVAILLYGSVFYHQVMVKFARLNGFEVRYHYPNGLTPWERCSTPT